MVNHSPLQKTNDPEQANVVCLRKRPTQYPIQWCEEYCLCSGHQGNGPKEDQYPYDDDEVINPSYVSHPIGIPEKVSDAFSIFDKKKAKSNTKKS